MSFVYFSIIALVVLIFFVVTPKQLHLFEILMIWMLLIYLHEHIFVIISFNLEWLVRSEKVTDVLSFYLIICFLIPAIIIWCIDRMPGIHSVSLKILLLVSIIFTLAGMNYFAQQLGVFSPRKWNGWCYVIKAVAMLGFGFLIKWGSHLILRKEVRFNGFNASAKIRQKRMVSNRTRRYTVSDDDYVA